MTTYRDTILVILAWALLVVSGGAYAGAAGAAGPGYNNEINNGGNSTTTGKAQPGSNTAVAGKAPGKFADAKETAKGMAITLGTMFANFSAYYGDIALLLNDVALLLAIVFGIAALLKFNKYNQDPGNNPISHSFALLIVAGGLANIGLLATIGGNSIYGDGYTFLSYNVAGANSQTLSGEGVAILQGVLGFIQLIGFIAFFKGWIMLRNLGKPGGQEQQDSFYKGFIFMGAGIAAINVILTVKMIAWSIGMTEAVDNLLGL